MNPLNECFESISRRSFLRASAILTFAALPDFAFGAEVKNGRLLVILLRGGMDGLFAMPAVGDPGLQGLRKDLMPDGLLKLDGLFALHPALQHVHELYTGGQALLVHGVSYPYTGRSHFEGQDIMESGVLQAYSSPTGWLGRALDASSYTAVAMSLPVPLILRGKTPTESRYPTWISSPPQSVYQQLGALWANDASLAPVGAQLVATSGSLQMDTSLRMGDEADLPALAQQAAMRLRQDNGPRVAVLDHVGFDTHAKQPGQHSDKLRNVDQAIRAFHQGVGEDVWKDTLVVTVTEFGRTVAENGSFGTDHGWGTCIFVLGGALKKAGIVSDWPGLKPTNLFEGRDLKATLDARALYGGIVSATLGIDPEVARRDVIQFDATNAFDGYL